MHILKIFPLAVADIKGHKEAVTQMLDSLKTLSTQANDANVLDHVVALLALKTVSHNSSEVHLSCFEVREKSSKMKNS